VVRAWQLFYLLACLAPPGRSFVALVCEYVHSSGAPGQAAAAGEAREWAAKTWSALKRTTKAGPRRQVPARKLHNCTQALLIALGCHANAAAVSDSSSVLAKTQMQQRRQQEWETDQHSRPYTYWRGGHSLAAAQQSRAIALRPDTPVIS